MNSLYGTMLFSGDTIFTQNVADRNGGAFYAIGTSITFRDRVNITQSLAQNGGAMYFKSIAYLILSEATILATYHNRATQFGGVCTTKISQFQPNVNLMAKLGRSKYYRNVSYR